AGGSTITFAPGLSGTITLRYGLPEIFRSVQLLGPGANVLTVQRSTEQFTPDFRIFTVDGPAGDIQDVTVTLAGLTIANGRVTLSGSGGASGGGISNAATLTLANCALADNSAVGSGGGIYNNGALTLTGCTLSGNVASSGWGGAIGNELTAQLTLTNCTLAGNSALLGGGIESGFFGSVTLTNCTLAGNPAATSGGGIYNGGTLTLANTIVAANTAPTAPDVYGTVTSLGNNLVGNSSGSIGFGAGPLVGTATSPLDPLLTLL